MRSLACSMIVWLTLLAGTAHAAISPERAQLYRSLLTQPTSLALNQQYANLCITENDYEAAIPPLERLVALQPNNALLRLRLGQMYQGLGTQPMAQKYFIEAYNHPYATSEIKSKAQGYMR